MGLLFRSIFREVAASALLGSVLFTFVLFLQQSALPFRFLVNHSASPSMVGWLFLMLLPSTFPLTLPLGCLVGVLIALGRMSSDGEITALRASGIPGRRTAVPVLAFALLMTGLTALSSLWLTPASIRELTRMMNRIGAAQLTAEIQPRVFDESFPKSILYVGDVSSGRPVQWRNVFLADLNPAADRKAATTAAGERGDGPRVTVAAEALAVADPARNRIQLSLRRGRTYEAGADPSHFEISEFPHGEQVLEARARAEVSTKGFTATPTGDLFAAARNSVEGRIELHKRLALPLACLLLALTGLPLGVSTRKGGKSAAFVITVSFAFLYYMALTSLISLARERRLDATLAVWLPNFVFGLAGLVLLAIVERPGELDVVNNIRTWSAFQWARVQTWYRRGRPEGRGFPELGRRFFLLPQIIDTYVLQAFIFYFLVLLFSFVILIEQYNFFELLGDVFKNSIPLRELFTYLFYLTPKLICDAAPLSVLVAILVTFGMLAKTNEITAMKACGVSVYRLSMPLLLTSVVLSGALFAFDHYVATGANVIQDALRNKIKGRPAQTFYDPSRKWIKGEGDWIYYYKAFENDVMQGVTVFKLEPVTFEMRRMVVAEQARYEPRIKRWVFQNGWLRDNIGSQREDYRPFDGSTATFPEFVEPPSYFLKEVKTYKQMTYPQLEDYIHELQTSGFNTIPLQVQYHKKFALPVFCFVMALLSIPFAFLSGSKGAMTGVGISFGVVISYFTVNLLFEQLGNAALLPPAVAAWSPVAIFTLAGLFLMTRLRT